QARYHRSVFTSNHRTHRYDKEVSRKYGHSGSRFPKRGFGVKRRQVGQPAPLQDPAESPYSCLGLAVQQHGVRIMGNIALPGFKSLMCAAFLAAAYTCAATAAAAAEEAAGAVMKLHPIPWTVGGKPVLATYGAERIEDLER